MKSKFPSWLRVKIHNLENESKVRSILKQSGVHTVCQEAACPNLNSCFNEKSAAFLILGNKCTRQCRFCNISGGLVSPPDKREIEGISQAVRKLKLNYIVITSVTRDDLQDGGAGHFLDVMKAVRRARPEAGIEILTPDFGGNFRSVDTVLSGRPDVFNHNLETVEELYKEVRPGADYHRSLEIIKHAGAGPGDIPVKSGIMLGMGESKGQVLRALSDLRSAGCSILTLGQYLRPTKNHYPVKEYISPEMFQLHKREAYKIGFKNVMSAPLARSSLHAEQAGRLK